MKLTGNRYSADQHNFMCQNCGSFYTHIDVVDVTDQGGTTRVHGGDESGRTRIEMRDATDRGNRHTITLHYTCESCEWDGAISFQQHKGDTIVRSHRWRNPFDNPNFSAPTFTPSPYEA